MHAHTAYALTGIASSPSKRAQTSKRAASAQPRLLVRSMAQKKHQNLCALVGQDASSACVFSAIARVAADNAARIHESCKEDARGKRPLRPRPRLGLARPPASCQASHVTESCPSRTARTGGRRGQQGPEAPHRSLIIQRRRRGCRLVQCINQMSRAESPSTRDSRFLRRSFSRSTAASRR